MYRTSGRFDEVFQQTLPWMVGLLALLIVLLFAAHWLRTRFRDDSEDPDAQRDKMLLEYRELQRQGNLTDVEFRSIQERLLKSPPAADSADSDDQVNLNGPPRP